MIKYIINKLKLIDNILNDILGDLKSLRYQLVIAAFSFNIWLFKNHASDNIMLAAIGLLASVYSMYFYSKHQQAKIESARENYDVQVAKDPDRIPDN